MTNLCPACETGKLVARVSDRAILFEGKSLRVPNLHYSECSNCGETVVLPAQAKLNEVSYADAKKGALGLWTCGRIEAFRKEWKLTQAAASQMFGGGPNAFSKYERGEIIHSRSMDLLMRVFDQVEDARIALCKMAHITLPTVPSWETVPVAESPKRRANLGAFFPSYTPVKGAAANGERWETYEVADGH